MQENRRVWPGDASRGEIEVLEEREAWSNEVARLLEARVRYPSVERGRHVERTQFRLGHAADHADGVVVAPITAEDRILLVRQFRHPVRMWMRELPRGGRAREETPEDAAARELREEIGYEVESLHALGRVTTDSGQLTGIPHLFAARVRPIGRGEPEDTEAIDRTFAYTFRELKRACQCGELVDSFTLAAVLRLGPHFDGNRFVYRSDCAPAPDVGD